MPFGSPSRQARHKARRNHGGELLCDLFDEQRSISEAIRRNRPRLRKNASSTAKPSRLPWCLAMTSARSGGVSLDRSRAEASVTVFKLGRVGCRRWGVPHNSLQKPHYVKSAIVPLAEIHGASMATAPTAGGRNVKSVAAAATDAHERGKDFLSDSEIAVLLDAAKAGRDGIRDYLLILTMFRHGLRVSEAIGLRRDEVNLDHAQLWIRRLKNGLAVEHPIAGDELRAIKRYLAHPQGFAAVALRVGARAASYAPVRQLSHRRGRQTGRTAADPPHMLRH
jgi:type 1 fimbriae regulatory protein FimB